MMPNVSSRARQTAAGIKGVVVVLLLGLAVPTLAKPPIAPTGPLSAQHLVEAALAAAPAGTRFGLLVVDADGRMIVAINPDQRFIPASNTKMFTTAAAYALLPGMTQPDTAGGTEVRLDAGSRKSGPAVTLTGRGDARMSSAPDCVSDCLAALADAVAAKTRVVSDVIGDDALFPDQRWSPGMSWNNLGSNDATAASALSLDSNQQAVIAAPGLVGQPIILTVPPYLSVHNEAMTGPAGSMTTLVLEHRLNSREYRLYGTLPLGTAAWREWVGVDDPAHFAAWTLAQLLKARGVRVTGQIRTVHRAPTTLDDPTIRGSSLPGGSAASSTPPLASLIPPPLADDVAIINKLSQNHHAELMLRRIARQRGTGSLADGLAAEHALFAQAGIPRAGYDFSDGSGMSTYNRVSPRAAVALLWWIAGQPWGTQWYASLPIAGVDGTLKRRFNGTPLASNLAAKTGSLNATSAISGIMRASSGQQLTFAFFANDVPNGQNAVPVMDAALLIIAANN